MVKVDTNNILTPTIDEIREACDTCDDEACGECAMYLNQEQQAAQAKTEDLRS